MRSRLALLAVTSLLLVGCGLDGGPTVPVSPDGPPGESPALETPPTPPEGTPGEATPGVTEGPVCLSGDAFVEEGVVPLDVPAVGGAREVRELRWERHDGCERFVIQLDGQDGAPASTVGAVRVEVVRELGIVRIALIHVRRVEPPATEAVFEGPLARRAYAVAAPDDGSIHVDLHLGEAAEAHVEILSDPARVVVDLRASGGPVPEPPSIAEQVVVLRPAQGAAAYPLEVVGYARTFEANVTVRLEQDGEDVFEGSTTASAWADAWGHFSLTIDDGPAGPVVLHVGERSARDGAWEGVQVELEMAP